MPRQPLEIDMSDLIARLETGARVLSEKGFPDSAEAVRSAIPLLAEEAENNVKLRLRVHELEEKLSAKPGAGSGGDARAQFEAWRKTLIARPNLMRNGELDYEDYDTQLAWSGWQAALAARQPVGVAPIDFCPFCGGDKGHWEGCRAPVTAEALGTGYGLPKPSIHSAAHYSAFLTRDAQKHIDSAKARALTDAALVIDLLGLEIRRLHQELAETPPAPAAVPVDDTKRKDLIYRLYMARDMQRAGGWSYLFAEAADALEATHPQPAAADCARCSGSGEDPEGFYDQTKGPDGGTHEGPCRSCGGSGDQQAKPAAAKDGDA